MMPKSAIFYLVLSLSLLTGSLAACRQEAAQLVEGPAAVTATATPEGGERGGGGLLRLSYWEAPTILNPHLSFGIKDWEASRITYEPLASFDAEGNLVPFLASEIPTRENGDLAADGRSVTWRLKQNVRWADGEPFTAADVLFTYDFIMNPDVGSASAASYEAISHIELLDAYTVRLHFTEANPAWALPFVGIRGLILPRHQFEAYNGENARDAPANLRPAGTGPYWVVDFKPQEVLLLGTQIVETNKIIFEPNPHFREPGKPYFSRIELRGGGTANEAARSVLQDGLVDYAYNLQVPPEVLARLDFDTGNVQAVFRALVEQIDLNRTDPNRETSEGERSSLQFPHPFFSDKRVRQAFAHAVNRERIAALYGLAAQPTTNQLVAPPEFVSPHRFYEYDLEKAAQLLDEAGWQARDRDGVRMKDGERLKVLFQTTVDPTREQIVQIIQEEYGSIGIEVALKLIDAGIFFSGDPTNPNTADRFYADMQEFDIVNLSPEPGPFLQYWTCDQIPQRANNWLAGFNSPRWCNPEYDALLEAAQIELDPKRRRQLFTLMNEMLVEDVVMIPLVHIARLAGFAHDLEDVVLTPWDADTWNIKDWRRR
jgi:peptide/nickel transport system substrate-binding protein